MLYYAAHIALMCINSHFLVALVGISLMALSMTCVQLGLVANWLTHGLIGYS